MQSTIAPPAAAGTVSMMAAQELPDLVARLLPSVVNISVLKKAGSDPTDPPDQVVPDRAQGSGFIISADGLIVTNKHVVENGYNITVAFNDGTTAIADVLSINQRPDLALLKVKPETPLPFVEFGDSDALRTGETVLAIGNPLGLTSSLSVGVVSALNRDVNLTMIDDYIQTDAAINHGSSGGPLFNLKGKVVGVNWALFAPGTNSGSAGLGLAIPSNDAVWIVEEMRRYGRLRAGFAGLRMQQVTPDIQRALGLPSRTGGIVTMVIPGTAAAKIGIVERDVVLALEGHEPHDVRALLRSLGKHTPGTTASLTIWHDGTIRKVDLLLTDWPNNMYDPAGPQPSKAMNAHGSSPDLGLTLSMAAASSRQTVAMGSGTAQAAEASAGVVVANVAADSAAADLRINPGDLILRIDGDRVTSTDQVAALMESARAKGRKEVLMLIDARGTPRWVVLPLQR